MIFDDLSDSGYFISACYENAGKTGFINSKEHMIKLNREAGKEDKENTVNLILKTDISTGQQS